MVKFIDNVSPWIHQRGHTADASDALALVGTFVLVVYSYAWLGFAFLPMVLYLVSQKRSKNVEIGKMLNAEILIISYYRETSREVKRVESLLRSHVYSSFAEQVSTDTKGGR